MKRPYEIWGSNGVNEEGERLDYLGYVEANTAHGALVAYLDGGEVPVEHDSYVIVPARFVSRVSAPRVETQTTLIWDEVTEGGGS